MLGIKLRIYQSFIIDCIIGKLPDLTGPDRKNFIFCLGRQVGKSTTLKCLGLWAAYFNKYPSGSTGETKVYFVSRSDDQAKELLEGIRSMIRQGDIIMSKITQSTKSHDVHWLSQKITEPNNTSQITFKNAYGKLSFIKSSPPTDNIIGKSADMLIIDEAAKLHCPDPDNWFNEAAVPTTTSTNGITIINSTPNGQTGFYFELFDPNDIKAAHSYYRIWFPYSINTESKYLEKARQEQERLIADGKIKEWEQEYEARFTTQTSAFFDSAKVDSGIDMNLSEVYQDDGPCSIGVDYGMVNSQTVVTIAKSLKTLRQHAYVAGDDGLTLYDDICRMVDEYHAEYVVVDDCPQGFMLNNRLVEKYGESPNGKVIKISFKRDKVKMFTEYRRRLYDGSIKYPKIRELVAQMKGMQEIQNKVNVSIDKGPGMRDDRVDSEIMSKYPYFNTESNALVGIETIQWIDPYADMGGDSDIRGDKKWLELQNEWQSMKKELKLH
jgi:hypothetical protein